MENNKMISEVRNQLMRSQKSYIEVNLSHSQDSFLAVEIGRREYDINNQQHFHEIGEDGVRRYYKANIEIDELNSYETEEVYRLLKEIQNLEGKKRNYFTPTFKALGIGIMILSLFTGINIVAEIGVFIIASGLVSGILFLAVGEIIRLLHNISLN